MALKCKSIVKFLLLLFLVDMFVFPVVLKTSIPFVTEATVIVSIVIILFESIVRKDMLPRIVLPILPMILYVAYAFVVGCFMAIIDDYDILLIFPAVEMIALMVIVAYIITVDGDMEYIAFLGMCLSTALGIYTLLNLNTLMGNLYYRLELAGNLSANTTGLLMLYGILGTYLAKKTEISKYIKLFVNILCVLVIILTSSRQSLIIAAVLYVFWLFKERVEKRGQRKRMKIGSVIFVGIVLILVVWVMNSGLLDQFVDTKLFYRLSDKDVGTTASDNRRAMLYKLGFEAFLDAPIFGQGYNNLSAYTHSTYMEVLGGTGLVGFCLFYTPLFLSVVKAIKSMRSDKEYERKKGYTVCTITLVLFIMMFVRAIHYYIVAQIILTLFFTIGSRLDQQPRKG